MASELTGKQQRAYEDYKAVLNGVKQNGANTKYARHEGDSVIGIKAQTWGGALAKAKANLEAANVTDAMVKTEDELRGLKKTAKEAGNKADYLQVQINSLKDEAKQQVGIIKNTNSSQEAIDIAVKRLATLNGKIKTLDPKFTEIKAEQAGSEQKTQAIQSVQDFYKKTVDEVKSAKAEVERTKRVATALPDDQAAQEAAKAAQEFYNGAVEREKIAKAKKDEAFKTPITKSETTQPDLTPAAGDKQTVGNALPSGAKVQGKNVVDASGKVIGTTEDGKTYKPSIAATGGTGGTRSIGGAGTGGTGTGSQKVSSVKTPPPSTGKKTIDEIYKLAQEQFGPIDTIFKTDKELAGILTQAINEKWTGAAGLKRFTDAVASSNWYRSNATQLQQRGFAKRQYTDLVNAIPANDPERQAKIDSLNSTTTYGRGLESAKRVIQAQAMAEGAVIDAAALDNLAKDVYDHALETDAYAIRNYVTNKIKYSPTAVLNGQAGKDLADLKATATANGINLDTAFGSSLTGWLQNLAKGESVETYKNIIRQTAKLGMPDKVASLLDNGVDLNTIYSPYKNLLANTLEINPETIKLDDPTLRAAISPQGEMSLYDYSKMLRKDNRWQYTQQARGEVADSVKQVLNDFGFQG